MATKITSVDQSIVTQPDPAARTLRELLDGITPDNIPDESFDDGPRGEEAI